MLTTRLSLPQSQVKGVMVTVYVFRHVGGLLEFSESQCCIVEDSDVAVSGYVVTCPDVGQYYKWFDETWLPTLKDKCPKLSASDSDSEVCPEKLICFCLIQGSCGSLKVLDFFPDFQGLESP